MSLRLSSARRREKAAREAERRELIASLASTRQGAGVRPMTGEFSPWGALALLLLAALALFHRPLGCLLRLAVRSSVGLAVLALFSSVGHYIGVNLGVNLVNALVLGVLGVPGFGLLLMLQWALR